MEARELAFFKRYLKENDLYYKFLYDVRKQQAKRIGGTPLREFLRQLTTSSDIIMYTIEWDRAKYPRWNRIYTKFIDFKRRYLKKYKDDKEIYWKNSKKIQEN